MDHAGRQLWEITLVCQAGRPPHTDTGMLTGHNYNMAKLGGTKAKKGNRRVRRTWTRACRVNREEPLSSRRSLVGSTINSSSGNDAPPFLRFLALEEEATKTMGTFGSF